MSMMLKKWFSLILLSAVLISALSVCVFAAEAKSDENSPAPADKSKCLIFDNSKTKWAGPIQFYVYNPMDGSELIEWGSEELNGAKDSDNIWYYDPAAHGMRLDENEQYCVIFVDAASGNQTYDLVFETSCLGDTATVTDKRIENPKDDDKSAAETVWKSGEFGSALKITSIGNVVGTYCPANNSPYNMYVEFLKNDLQTARDHSGKTDQEILDNTALAIGLTDIDVEKAIAEAGVDADWIKGSSDAPRTGYTTQLYLAVLLLLLASCGAGVSVYQLSKKND